MAGIKTVTIGYRPMSRQTRSMGPITYDEGRVSRVVSRVDGYVERLYVDNTFTRVRKGEPLAEIHSPELGSACASCCSPPGATPTASRLLRRGKVSFGSGSMRTISTTW